MIVLAFFAGVFYLGLVTIAGVKAMHEDEWPRGVYAFLFDTFINRALLALYGEGRRGRRPVARRETRCCSAVFLPLFFLPSFLTPSLPPFLPFSQTLARRTSVVVTRSHSTAHRDGVVG